MALAAARRARWGLLLLAVLLLHGAAVSWLDEAIVGWGAASSAMPQRIEVAFVKTLTPQAPPAAAPLPSPAAAAAPRPRRARAVAPAASAAASAASAALEPKADVAPSAPSPIESASASASASAPQVTPPEPVPATAAAASSPAASSAAVFEWPPSTRLTYALAGNYRGEIHGNARVQWLRLGERYQVHLDITVGPSFAPLMARNMTSDGELGAAGLVPRRYDEATKLPFQSPRRASMQFTPEQVTLANGSTRESLPGVQDTASQFVQMTWLFTTRPELLRVGNSIELPLALPRRMDRWTYDVLAEERLFTPVGALDTFHLKPRRAADRPRGELSAEVWFAPSLQYLPVRIRIQQDADTYVDLMMDAAPLQSAPESGPR